MPRAGQGFIEGQNHWREAANNPGAPTKRLAVVVGEQGKPFTVDHLGDQSLGRSGERPDARSAGLIGRARDRSPMPWSNAGPAARGRAMPGEGTGVTRRGAVLGAAGLAAMLPSVRPGAQPIAGGRPVRVVVPYPASGAVDLVGRLLAERMEPALGQQVVVDNRRRRHRGCGRGGQGRAGRNHARRDRHDHALRLQDALQPPALRPGQGIRVNKDAQRRNGWTDFRRFVSWMRANPDALRFGTAGVGTTAHFTMAAVGRRRAPRR